MGTTHHGDHTPWASHTVDTKHWGTTHHGELYYDNFWQKEAWHSKLRAGSNSNTCWVNEIPSNITLDSGLEDKTPAVWRLKFGSLQTHVKAGNMRWLPVIPAFGKQTGSPRTSWLARLAGMGTLWIQWEPFDWERNLTSALDLHIYTHIHTICTHTLLQTNTFS